MIALLILVLFGAFLVALLLFTFAFAAIGIGAFTILGLMLVAFSFMRAILRR